MAEKRVVPIIRELPWDLETAVSVFSRFRREPHAFLLESVEGGESWGRYSFIGIRPSAIFRSSGSQLEIRRGRRTGRKKGDPIQEI